jgi:hypothetical protein
MGRENPVDEPLTSQIDGVQYSDMTDDQIRLDVLKAAVVNPELYNTMRQLMVNHPYPQRLDENARRLRRIFMELDHGTQPGATASAD